MGCDLDDPRGASVPKDAVGDAVVDGGGDGLCVAGRNATVVWQSAHFVGNVECPGNVLLS